MSPENRLARLVAVVGVCLGLGVAGCGGGNSSPTAPAATTAPTAATVSVALTGSASFSAVGQFAQLAAIATLADGKTIPVLADAAWTTSNPQVATVDATGLVTSTGSGAATIGVTYQAKSSSLVAVVAPTTGRISACGTYTGAGPFTVTGDLSGSPRLCVTLANVSAAVLDCQGHDIASLSISHSTGLTVRNCLIHGAVANASTALRNLRVDTSTGLTIENSDVSGQALITGCQGCVFRGDRFIYPDAGFPISVDVMSCEFCIGDGSRSILADSTLDGGFGGNFSSGFRYGADDVVFLNSEANLTIQGNVIRRAWDACIEPATNPGGPVTMTIVDNQIATCGLAALGAYWIEGFRDSVFARNTVSQTPSLVKLDASGAAIIHLSSLTFVNNQFTDNTLVSPAVLPPEFGSVPAASMIIDYSSTLPSTIAGNVIRNNNLGAAAPAPMLLPLSGFIDGGGNICAPGPVLRCGGSSSPRH